MYVTHDQEEALAISDRIAVMDKRVIQQVQSPESTVTGVLDGNPIHEDMIKAARMTNLMLLISVINDAVEVFHFNV